MLRVFVDDHDAHGNPLGVVLDGAAMPDSDRRQRLAAALGFSETIFIDDIAAGWLRIFTPATELPFAGHPVIGAAWIIARELGSPPTTLETPSGPLATWVDGQQVWVRGRIADTPPWWQERLPDSAAVARLTGPLSPH